jgi:hypothetical protein
VTGSRARSNVTAHARVAVLGSLAVVAAFALAAAAAALGGARPELEQPRAKDGRCVVYTYFEDQGMGDEPALEVWRDVWAKAGWDPVVLSQKDAERHPRYDEMVRRFSEYPTVNAPGYELACYLRYLAMAVVGGGFMTDYDVINVNVPPPPTCDWLPNDGAFTTHEKFVPSVATGTAAEFDRVVNEFYDVDVNAVLQATGSGDNHVSDMILDLYLIDQGKISEATSLAVSPAEISDPPCDARGAALPLMLHFSHHTMADVLSQTDRPATMRAWADALRDASSQCKDVPAHLDVETYAKTFFAQPGANRWVDAVALVHACEGRANGACDAETDDMDQDSAQALFSSAVDKNGQPITRRMMDRPVAP